MTSTQLNPKVVTDIQCPNLKLFKKGKVRSVFDFGDQLLIVASDRVSAFDVILDDGIPGKGSVLTEVSEFWFNRLKDLVPHHLISTQLNDFPTETQPYHAMLEGRSMLVKKTELIEVECVVRGYIVGSGWKEYQKDGTVCGIALPQGLRLADPLPEPIFTPAAKASQGHDENITLQTMENLIGKELTQTLSRLSLAIYEAGRAYAQTKGIILADTKFEFGIRDGKVVLIDEVLTPDSSRYWPKSEYQPGVSPPSFDKQIIRDYLETTSWNKQAPGPRLPEDIIQTTAAKYQEAKRLLLG